MNRIGTWRMMQMAGYLDKREVLSQCKTGCGVIREGHCFDDLVYRCIRNMSCKKDYITCQSYFITLSISLRCMGSHNHLLNPHHGNSNPVSGNITIYIHLQ